MKSELRETANSAVEKMLVDALGDKLIRVRCGKKDGFAINTGYKDENGKTIWAVVESTVKNTDDTKTTKAFDIDVAMAEYAEQASKPVKEKKSTEPDPEAAAKKAKREAQQAMLEVWLLENLTEKQVTTTDVQAAVPDLADVSIMQVGTFLKNIAANNPTIVREVIKGKPHYRRATAEEMEANTAEN